MLILHPFALIYRLFITFSVALIVVFIYPIFKPISIMYKVFSKTTYVVFDSQIKFIQEIFIAGR